MPFQNILWEKREEIGILTINRPEVHNALSQETLLEIETALHGAEEDEGLRVVIITGAGNKAFSAGADINQLLAASMLDFWQNKGPSIFFYIHHFPKPLIAAVNGLALGGGCELAMACDFRVGSENARFGQPEIHVGIFPGSGGTQRLQRLIGVGRAKELIFTGDTIDAREAERFGLLNKIFPAEELIERTMEIAGKICSKSPLALKMAKAAINMGLEIGLQPGLAYERLGRTIIQGSEDRVEGTRAFLEKRKPAFKGR